MKKIISTIVCAGHHHRYGCLAAAQEITPAERRTPVINKRQRHQHKRIRQGVPRKN